jgi:hypothetical protein
LAGIGLLILFPLVIAVMVISGEWVPKKDGIIEPNEILKDAEPV